MMAISRSSFCHKLSSSGNRPQKPQDLHDLGLRLQRVLGDDLDGHLKARVAMETSAAGSEAQAAHHNDWTRQDHNPKTAPPNRATSKQQRHKKCLHSVIVHSVSAQTTPDCLPSLTLPATKGPSQREQKTPPKPSSTAQTKKSAAALPRARPDDHCKPYPWPRSPACGQARKGPRSPPPWCGGWAQPLVCGEVRPFSNPPLMLLLWA